MNTVTEFIVGQYYTNDQIRYSLNLENLGGVRPSVGDDGYAKHVAIMTTTLSTVRRKIENPYHDRIEGNILVYTAVGKEGNQLLSGKNKRFLEQYERPIPFYGFTNEGRQVYRFLGLLELIRHYQEPQLDISGKIRIAWAFEFYIHSVPVIIPIVSASEIAIKLILESRKNQPIEIGDREIQPNNFTDSMQLPISDPEINITNEERRLKLLDMDPYKFEHFVKAIVEKSGFDNVQVTRSSGDGGIDLNAVVDNKNDFFAGTLVQFQAKRWRHAVGSVELNGFRGAMSSSAKGVFVTTSRFTKAAVSEARNPYKPSVMLIDGSRLSTLVERLQLQIEEYLQ